MFLFFDIHQFRKQLEFYQTITCSQCGRFGRYEVYLMGNRFRLFFIPVFTFGRKYMVRTTCCDTWYLLHPEKGKAIAKGESVKITAEDLELYRAGAPIAATCPHCGLPYDVGSNYCPHCGEPLTGRK